MELNTNAFILFPSPQSPQARARALCTREKETLGWKEKRTRLRQVNEMQELRCVFGFSARQLFVSFAPHPPTRTLNPG